MKRNFTWPLLGLLGSCLLASQVQPARAALCPFCSMQGQTLLGDINQASMVLFGTLTNARLDAKDDLGQGTTDLQIEAVIKKNEILGDKKVITLPRYIPSDKDNKVKYLIFCDVYKGKIDPYRGVPVAADGNMVKYLKGALAIKDKPINDRLRYYFDYLDDKEQEIATDAYKEFANADYKDYREMAKHLPADKIAHWIQDPSTPSFRFGLYASMLGHCGRDQHAAVLRSLLDDPQKRANTGIDGILAGYMMLKPREGWNYICAILKDPAKEFMLRYAALRAVRFFWDMRGDLVPRKELAAGVVPLLDQSDIADLAIEDLRKWGCWDACEHILGLQTKKTHDAPIIRRAILRYALSCPDARAAAFVKDSRKRDPEMVKDLEEILKLESGKAS
jgi:hypothetical protein